MALRAGYGAFLLVAPGRLLGTGSDGVPGWASPVARVLGARHLAQAAVLAARPRLADAGALVDAAHASTDVACAALRPDMRTPTLLDAGVATALAVSSRWTSPS